MTQSWRWKVAPICCDSARFEQGEGADYTDVTLANLLDLGVMEHLNFLEAMSSAALKEFSLRRALQAMKKEWRGMEFVMLAYNDTWLVKGTQDIQSLLDEHFIKVQAIRSSPFSEPFALDCRLWEGKMEYIMSAIEHLLMVQRTWLYLWPIFQSADITQHMPAEETLFRDVDRIWRLTMDAVSKNPSVIDFSDLDNLLPNLQDANSKLERITSQINDYLDAKRMYFPRFFFLSNDELLSILSDTKEPVLVQPHLSKCFEGIHSVQFDEKVEVIEAMVSSAGEVVEMVNKVNVTDVQNVGNVERWLGEVEKDMVGSMRSVIEVSLKDWKHEDRIDWLMYWQAQVVLTVNMLYWTKEVTSHLNARTMPKYLNKLNTQLIDVVALVRGKLTDLQRQTLGALMTVDVHNRDVCQMLAESQVVSADSFEWLSQIRYYWNKPGNFIQKNGKPSKQSQLEVKSVNSILLYQFEYLGNSDRLVITPLTDRCYRTLMGAFHLNYGGAPEGPAGTGKTETTKDLAKLLAIKCVVFNCSDGLNCAALSKFFKGLASSGSWVCFDEFNRIDVEVLSVIAQQIMTIQLAVRQQRTEFVFEGVELKLVPSCGVNTTMNPGYAGRVELPDNLKALFRPCAMMVPDYALIAEIVFYSYGFEKSTDLGQKATQVLRLASEQLSPQDHYDFGMRGLKSLLVSSGQLKQKYGNSLPEHVLAAKAFLDVNEPKFTSGDIPLFRNIVSDLFPEVERPPNDNAVLEDAFTQATKELGLQCTNNHLAKCVQLWETTQIRHGVMTIGLPPCGKTSISDTVVASMELLPDEDGYPSVICHRMNPKSVTQRQLYGRFDENTYEWTDGILSVAVRQASLSETSKRQWVMLDGPVDPLWIEDMNSVLDDNKKLCLLSGEIINLTPLMTMMFEATDLSSASPATVSRVGIVFMEPEHLGWKPIMTSWLEKLPAVIDAPKRALVESLFHAYMDPALEYVQTLAPPVPALPVSVGIEGWFVWQCLRFLEALLVQHFDHPKAPIANEATMRVESLFFFSMIWSVGGCLDEKSRAKFDEFLRDMLACEDDFNETYGLVAEYKPRAPKVVLPEPGKGPLYNFYIMPDGRWTVWTRKLEKEDIPASSEFHRIIVPTGETVRNESILDLLVQCGHPALFMGSTGTGKTTSVRSLLDGFDADAFSHVIYSFSAKTTHNQTQDIIDSSLDRRRKGVYGPPVGKKMVVFIDDVNLPSKERWGTQGPIEILCQLLGQGGWYSRRTAEFQQLVDVQIVSAMGLPDSGRNHISARFAWRQNLVMATPYSNDGLTRIYETVMKQFIKVQFFPNVVVNLVRNVVVASIEVYQKVSSELLPTPSKSHYTFNLRDLAKVLQGVTLATRLRDVDSFAKLWGHEIMRVFQDRLVDDEEKEWFRGIAKEKMHAHFHKIWTSIVKNDPLIFGDFANPKEDYYHELDHDELMERMKEYLVDYNVVCKRQMNLQLFLPFVEHVARMVRICKLPLGNALLVGIGGSGRKSVATLATFVVGYELCQVEVSNSYGQTEWYEDLKRVLITAGCKAKSVTFLFSDTQLIDESFLEDLCHLLNTGEVPGLFLPEDKAPIMELCAGAAAKAGVTGPDIFRFFLEESRKKFHIALCMSPIGQQFRRRLRDFPALVNCTAIDWYKDWPREALTTVADGFLMPLELPEETHNGVVEICVQMQRDVVDMTERWRTEMGRYFYVTPTSYLDLLLSFIELLQTRRGEVVASKKKYEVGVNKIAETAVAVEEMQRELTEMEPKLTKMQDESNKMVKTIWKSTRDAAVTQRVVETEEATATEQAEIANKIRGECQTALDEAMPAFNEAIAAVKALSKGDVAEIKSMKAPPPGVMLVAKSLCIMFGVKPNKSKPPQDGSKSKVEVTLMDYFIPAQKVLFSDTNFLLKLINYDKNNIPEEVVTEIQPFESDQQFDPDIMRRSSVAACGICKWVRALIVYDRVYRAVGPRRKALKEADLEVCRALANVKMKKKHLEEVLQKVRDLQEKMAEAQAKQKALTDQVEDCKLRLSRAEKLLSVLGDQSDSWASLAKNLGEDYLNLTGDTVVASAFIAYLGVFSQSFRKAAVEKWVGLLSERGITVNPNFQLQDVFGDPMMIQQWIIDKLPKSQAAVDNAVIMKNSRRWPLMIDPQLQANKWLRHSYKELKVLRLTDATYSRTLESAVTFGLPVRTLGGPVMYIGEERTHYTKIMSIPLYGPADVQRGNVFLENMFGLVCFAV